MRDALAELDKEAGRILDQTPWGFTTDLFGKIGEASGLLLNYLRKIYPFAFFFLSASLIMLIIHLLVD
jgi:hypothetical protein